VESFCEKGSFSCLSAQARRLTITSSTLLKSDQWLSESHRVEDDVRGAINFRNVPGTKIYALGQPTLEAIDEVVNRVRSAHPSFQRIVWITLREEPIVYINGAPYCLRKEGSSLRNMKGHSNGNASPFTRFYQMLCRLRWHFCIQIGGSRRETQSRCHFGIKCFWRKARDVSSCTPDAVPSHTGLSRLLLHTETSDGSVVPVWEEVQSDDVEVLKDIMATRRISEDGFELYYTRIPITAENPPDSTDLHDLTDVVVRTDATNTPIVVNCQLGRGRSTLASVSDF